MRRLPAFLIDRRNAGILVGAGILLIGLVDFFSGIELRVFPLYYGPIAYAAWSFGRPGALAAATASALGWFLANQLAGQQYSHIYIWIANILMQAASFVVVGFLVAGVRTTLARERALARTDALSGLMNQRAFYEECGRVLNLCRRGRRPVTLAYLDLDDFKAINDTRGHQAGDELLRAVGQVLRSTVRSSDVTARLGGDEFAILLPELGPVEAGQALTRLGDAIRNLGDAPGAITASIGAITLLSAPDDVGAMVQQADATMYRAKRDGKNRVRLDVAGERVAAAGR